jgi:ParB/RepB/Spo0J family partition protein
MTKEAMRAAEFVPLEEIVLVEDRANTPEDLSALAASMEEHGLLQPAVLVERGEGRYEAVAGCRRVKAAKMLGWERIPAIVLNRTVDGKLGTDDPARLRALTLAENANRRDMHPLDEAEYFAALKGGGMSIAAMARVFDRKGHEIHARVQLTRLIPGLKAKVREGAMTLPAAAVLADLPEDAQEKFLQSSRASAGLWDAREFASSWSGRFLSYLTSGQRAACGGCKSRTNLEDETLFADAAEGNRDICFDAGCYRGKFRESVRALLEEAGKGEPGGKAEMKDIIVFAGAPKGAAVPGETLNLLTGRTYRVEKSNFAARHYGPASKQTFGVWVWRNGALCVELYRYREAPEEDDGRLLDFVKKAARAGGKEAKETARALAAKGASFWGLANKTCRRMGMAALIPAPWERGGGWETEAMLEEVAEQALPYRYQDDKAVEALAGAYFPEPRGEESLDLKKRFARLFAEEPVKAAAFLYAAAAGEKCPCPADGGFKGGFPSSPHAVLYGMGEEAYREAYAEEARKVIAEVLGGGPRNDEEETEGEEGFVEEDCGD